MSELAFDANGDPITFPAEAEELRVRRFRNPGMRGACEVVHDRDGSPLYVAVDAGYVEFRKVVDGVPGRYRLDPVDASRRVIANSTPAYITITEAARSAATTTASDERDSVIRELARANADMTKTIADRFASVMQAAADLLRAADGAGLPKREPAAPAPVDDRDEEDEDLDDDEEDAAPDVASLVAQILPTIQMWLATRAAPSAVPPAAASASAPLPAPAPAPAAAPVMASGEAAAAAGVVAPAGAAGSTVQVEPATVASTQTAAAGAEAVAPTAVAGAAEARNAGATPSPAQTAHLLAIHGELSPEEKRVAQLVVTRMQPELRAQWIAELSGMTVKQAVELVRSMIPTLRGGKESDS